MAAKKSEKKKNSKQPKFKEFFNQLSESTINNMLTELNQKKPDKPLQDMIDRMVKFKTEKFPNKLVFGSSVINYEFRNALSFACEFARIPEPINTIRLHYKKLKFRDDLYPRDLSNDRVRKEIEARSHKQIKSNGKYFSGLNAIVVNERNELIDGYINVRAYQRYIQDFLKTDIEDFFVEVVVVPTKDDTELYQFTLSYNNKNGLSYTREENKNAAQELFDKGLDMNDIAETLSVSTKTVGRYLESPKKAKAAKLKKSILQKVKEKKSCTQIANEVGINKSQVSRNLDKWFKEIIQEKLKRSVPVQDIAEELNISRKKFDELKSKIPTDVNEEILPKYPKDGPFPSIQWNHMGDKRNANEVKYEGRTPICYMENLLYYHTKPGDLVVDLFAGSGTMIDACNNMKRRWFVSDLKPTPERPQGDIIQWNINDGLPPQIEGLDVKLLFLDPPYGTSAIYSKNPKDLSQMSPEEFEKSMKGLLENIGDMGHIEQVAVFIEPIFQNEKNEYIDYTIMMHKYMPDDFVIDARYVTSHGTANSQLVKKLKKLKICLSTTRDLWIYKRVLL